MSDWFGNSKQTHACPRSCSWFRFVLVLCAALGPVVALVLALHLVLVMDRGLLKVVIAIAIIINRLEHVRPTVC